MTKLIDHNTAKRAAEELLIAFFHSDEGRAEVVRAFPTAERWPKDYRSVYRAALVRDGQGKPHTVTGWAADAGIDADKLAFVEASKPLRGAKLVDQCAVLREWSQQSQVLALAPQAEMLAKKDGAKAALSFLLNEGARIMADEDEERPVDGVSLADALDAQLEADAVPGYETNRPWLDQVMLGYAPGDITIKSGAYKGRKSSDMRNDILGLLANGTPVSVFLMENDQLTFMAEMRAMLANLYLIWTGRPEFANLWARRIMRRNQAWKPEHWEALGRARDVWKRYLGDKLHVYDVKDGVRNPTVLRSKLQRDVKDRGVRVGFVDYGMLLDWTYGRPDLDLKDRDMAARAHDWLMGLKELDVATCVLWQMRESEQEEDRHGAGLMGGMALPAVADFVHQVRYDKAVPDVLHSKMRVSRHSGEGESTEFRVKINRFCGMELGYWPTPDRFVPVQVVPKAMLLGDKQAVPGRAEASLSGNLAAPAGAAD